MTFIPIPRYGPDGMACALEFHPAPDNSHQPLSTWRTCLDCGLADWHQTFETLVSFINKCPHCQSLRLKSEMKRRAL